MPLPRSLRPGTLGAAAATLLALFAAGPLAAAPACGGRDLLAEMAIREPERRRAVEAEAARVENGRSVFWRIEPKGGGRPSWLLGTAHLSDPRVVDLAPAVRAALDGARVVALENTSVLDMSAARSAYGASIRHMIYTDGRTLPAVLGPDTWARLRTALEARRIPAWSVMAWKPWMVTFGVLIYPPCELARWTAGESMLDVAVGRSAKAAGKPVLDLETTDDQFSALDAMTEAEQVRLLVATLAMEPRAEDMQETMVLAYEAGRVDLLWAHAMAQAAAGGADQAVFGSILRNASYRRNLAMMARARPLVDEGGAFLAVGALHLIGEQGLVRLFREAGYTVTPVP